MRVLVFWWAGAKFSVKLGSSPPNLQQESGGNRLPQNGEEVDTQERHFDTFAELYAAASPSKDPEKVLVAAYWHQEVKGQKELTSVVLNKDLTNLGHRITNINMKFDSLIGSKPQLALQLKKSGSAKQARKKYKLTKAGIAKVQGMLTD